MQKQSKKVIIGGTFEVLHRGHKVFLKKAFSLGKVFIGLVSDNMARKIKRRKVRSFKNRKKDLSLFIKKEFKTKPRIIKIKDKFGPTLKKDFDYIVVSPETHGGALLINKERKKRNKKTIKIIKIKLVLAKDKKPLSSTRILKGEINKEGRLFKNIK